MIGPSDSFSRSLLGSLLPGYRCLLAVKLFAEDLLMLEL